VLTTLARKLKEAKNGPPGPGYPSGCFGHPGPTLEIQNKLGKTLLKYLRRICCQLWKQSWKIKVKCCEENQYRFIENNVESLTSNTPRKTISLHCWENFAKLQKTDLGNANGPRKQPVKISVNIHAWFWKLQWRKNGRLICT
jgi:hypothetical protein